MKYGVRLYTTPDSAGMPCFEPGDKHPTVHNSLASALAHRERLVAKRATKEMWADIRYGIVRICEREVGERI